MEDYAAVVGGVNMDICGTSATAMLSGDSNPGQVTMTPGGVGRNIAENLSRMGCKVSLVTVLGEDAHLENIRRACTQTGIDLSRSEALPGERTGTYLCLNDPGGEMYAAVSDMSIYERITPEWLVPRLDFLNKAKFVVLDANLPEAALSWIANNCTAPLMADPVSAKKGVRLRPALSRLTMIKPNRIEAQLLSRVPIRGADGVAGAAQVLLRAGVKNVFISLGRDGVYWTDGGRAGTEPCAAETVINTTGCGDAFTAAASLALSRGADAQEAARYGQAASAICARSNASVSPEMSAAKILSIIHRTEEA